MYWEPQLFMKALKHVLSKFQRVILNLIYVISESFALCDVTTFRLCWLRYSHCTADWNVGLARANISLIS